MSKKKHDIDKEDRTEVSPMRKNIEEEIVQLRSLGSLFATGGKAFPLTIWLHRINWLQSLLLEKDSELTARYWKISGS